MCVCGGEERGGGPSGNMNGLRGCSSCPKEQSQDNRDETIGLQKLGVKERMEFFPYLSLHPF